MTVVYVALTILYVALTILHVAVTVLYMALTVLHSGWAHLGHAGDSLLGGRVDLADERADVG